RPPPCSLTMTYFTSPPISSVAIAWFASWTRVTSIRNGSMTHVAESSSQSAATTPTIVKSSHRDTAVSPSRRTSASWHRRSALHGVVRHRSRHLRTGVWCSGRTERTRGWVDGTYRGATLLRQADDADRLRHAEPGARRPVHG